MSQDPVKAALEKASARIKENANINVAEFLKHYYADLDRNLNEDGNLNEVVEKWYREDSMMTDGKMFQGIQAITNQLTAFRVRYERGVHNISTIDCQFIEPAAAGAIFVLVSGLLVCPRHPRPLKYSEIT